MIKSINLKTTLQTLLLPLFLIPLTFPTSANTSTSTITIDKLEPKYKRTNLPNNITNLDITQITNITGQLAGGWIKPAQSFNLIKIANNRYLAQVQNDGYKKGIYFEVANDYVMSLSAHYCQLSNCANRDLTPFDPSVPVALNDYVSGYRIKDMIIEFNDPNNTTNTTNTTTKGEKGDKGEKGERGLQGTQGTQGIQGERGLQGIQGIQGEKGERGLQGIQGDSYFVPVANNVVLSGDKNLLTGGSLETTSYLKAGNTNDSCITQLAGSIRFNQGKFEGCDGEFWQQLNYSNNSLLTTNVISTTQPSCQAIKQANPNSQDGQYTIDLTGFGNTLTVYCDMTTDSGGWLVIQRRVSADTNFYRDWQAYKQGFGNLDTNFWLGNDKIALLTQNAKELRIDMKDEAETAYAKYSSFRVLDESNLYKLEVSGYSGNAGDSLAAHNGRLFTTKDRDNDVHPTANCAVIYLGAWWYVSCHSSNLNGEYGNNNYGQGINWYDWKGIYNSLDYVEMKIR